MTQEDKELLLKDLCARLLYGVKVNVKGVVYDNRSCRLTDIHHGLDTYIGVHDGMQYHIESIKPYLFPFSSMTEEQKEETSKMFWDFDNNEFTNDTEFVDHCDCFNLIDWLNKNHFDYRGLIPKGLAIDASGLNIY